MSIATNYVKAFLNGVREFRLSWTTSYDDYSTLVAYDWGREIAHRITLRRFEQGS